MIQNYQNPTEYDLELIKVIYQFMGEDERKVFIINTINTFSSNDIIAIQELVRTIIFTQSIDK